MAENLFCPGQKIVSDNYRDGITRIWRGYPPMNDGIKSMLYDYAKDGNYTSISLFFTEKAGLGEDSEYCEFLIREIIRGYL